MFQLPLSLPLRSISWFLIQEQYLWELNTLWSKETPLHDNLLIRIPICSPLWLKPHGRHLFLLTIINGSSHPPTAYASHSVLGWTIHFHTLSPFHNSFLGVWYYHTLFIRWRSYDYKRASALPGAESPQVVVLLIFASLLPEQRGLMCVPPRHSVWLPTPHPAKVQLPKSQLALSTGSMCPQLVQKQRAKYRRTLQWVVQLPCSCWGPVMDWMFIFSPLPQIHMLKP